MKVLPWITLVCIVGFGCQNSPDTEKKLSDLQTQNRQLSTEIVSRDEYIETITQAVSAVYSNLETVRDKEKLLLHQTNEMESKKKLTNQEVRLNLLNQVALIDSDLIHNTKIVASLQAKISTYKTQYAGLKSMIANLRQTIADREQSITDLELRIQGLESQISEKTRLITQRDSVIDKQYDLIDSQQKKLTTGYYIVGRRRDLEDKGIIKNEGGFLWGLLGATTVLTNGFSPRHFNPINKYTDTTIHVDGSINEIVPKRNAEFYRQLEVDRNHCLLTISEPNNFWQNSYLVIVLE